MEEIYLKGFPREWHTKKIDLQTYFKTYSEAYIRVMKSDKINLSIILNSLFYRPELSQKEIKVLENMTSINQLKPFNLKIKDKAQLKKTKRPALLSKNLNVKKSPPGKKAKSQVPLPESMAVNETVTDYSLNPNTKAVDCTKKATTSKTYGSVYEEFEFPDVVDENEMLANTPETDALSPKTSLNVFNFQGAEKTSKYKNNIITNSIELLLNNSKTRKRNLDRGKHFVVSFRIYEPFSHDDNKIKNFMQEILVLDNQTLDVLRDKIICHSDFQDAQGDLSGNPDSSFTRLTKDVYRSGMFYFDNTFYVDLRYWGNEDYSSVIKEWAPKRGIAVGKTHDMRMKPVGRLKVRFGYPYLYMHQGCCEHLIIINDARLLTGKESLSSYDFPMITRIPRHVTNYCMICLTALAWWIIVDSDRMLHDTTFMCKNCFKSFNYIDGKKLSTFKAYRYNAKTALL